MSACLIHRVVGNDVWLSRNGFSRSALLPEARNVGGIDRSADAADTHVGDIWKPL